MGAVARRYPRELEPEPEPEPEPETRPYRSVAYNWYVSRLIVPGVLVLVLVLVLRYIVIPR